MADIEEFGHLLAVQGSYELPPEDRNPNDRHDEYVFRFEQNSIVVTAVADDDTISMAVGGATLPFVHDLTEIEPWDKIIGCGVLWLWSLTNHRGFLDGCQIEFGRPGECWGVQLMCEASSLSVRSLGPIENLWNQFGPQAQP
jgi:Family of unknown function (DUF6334)